MEVVNTFFPRVIVDIKKRHFINLCEMVAICTEGVSFKQNGLV